MIEEVVKYAIIAVIAVIVLNILEKIYSVLRKFIISKAHEHKINKHINAYIKKKIKEEKESVVYKYFGMLEFSFINCTDEESLKKDFCSIIKEKMESKHKNAFTHLNATDKIFFVSNKFNMLDGLVDDFIKLYRFFVDINKKRNITTNLKFSLWTKPGDISMQNAFKVLSELNGLNYINQVIANDEIYKQYQKNKLGLFNFAPYGVIKLVESDEDFELFRLVKNK